MKRLFARLYLMIILAFVTVGWGLDQLYEHVFQKQELVSDLDIHSGSLFLLKRELSRLPSDMHKTHLNALAKSFGYAIQLLDRQSLPDTCAQKGITLSQQQLHFLDEGGTLSAFDNSTNEGWFMLSLDNTESVLVLGPVAHYRDSHDTELYSLALFITFALVVFMLVWPLSRSLLALTQTAKKFGEGNFDERAPAHLSPPIDTLGHRFNDMASRIQRLIKSHKELSHAVSHELRTPVARIRFAAEMARSSTNEDKRNQYFVSIDDNIEELDSLIEELLMYARFDRESPELTLEVTNMVELCNEVVQKACVNGSNVQVKVSDKAEHDRECNIDKRAVARVLDNIIRNAYRFAKSLIHIELQSNNQVFQLRISDDGPGIPAAHRDNLFNPFVRLDKNSDTQSGGLGLGLAIAKRLVELHNGSIDIESSEWGGACFVVTLPLMR